MLLFDKFKAKIKDNTYFDLLLIGLIPTFLILVCTIIIAVLSFDSTKKQILLNAENTMNVLSSTNSETINHAIKTASIFVQ